MILRARWTGELPKVGEFLKSMKRPKFAYAIWDVDVLRAMPHHGPHTRLKLLVERVPISDVPSDATVHAWTWDARKKRGVHHV